MLDSIEDLKCFMSVLDELHDGAILCDSCMTIRHANKLAHTIFAYEAGELIGLNIDKLIPDVIR